MTEKFTFSGSIGVFDSGVGGLSVWREIARQLPREDILYVADQAHVPYGYRSMDEIKSFCEGIVAFLLERGAKIVVIACNAASAAALHHLRDLYPNNDFVGMEPAVKPAVKNTRTGVVGVLATQTTFQGKLFESLIAEHGNNTKVVTCVGHGLVENVEAGKLDTLETEILLKTCITPLLAAGADQLVLGCTHYPFLMPVMRKLAGPEVSIIDPSSAVASQTARVMNRRQLMTASGHKGRYAFLTSGHPVAFREGLHRLIPSFADRFQTGLIQWQSDCSIRDVEYLPD
ncbi:MAG: glutamate racemase [Desulfobacterales bacterium]